MTNRLTSQSEVGRLRRVLLKTPEAAFRSEGDIGVQWQGLNYLAKPDFKAAITEYEALIELF